MNNRNHLYLYLLLVIMTSSFTACKKSGREPEDLPESPTTGTRAQFTLDSIYLYSKYIYLWNDVLPDYETFNPRKYTTAGTDLLNFKQSLYDLSQYKLNAGTGIPYEKTELIGFSKYSYIEPGLTNGASVAALEGSGTAAVSSEISGVTAYLGINQFAHLAQQQTALENAFSRFATAGITTLIVDLRDNRGGYIETAEYLANLIASRSISGKKMYSEHFNSGMQNGKIRILENQPYYDAANQPVFLNGRPTTYADVDFSVAGNTFLFDKKGSLNTIENIYFLVNGSTASASELLINVLKPYYPVKLLGSRTFGKPVGSFGINIDRYALFVISFLIQNAEGAADYFEGMSVDVPAANTDFGTQPMEVLQNTLELVQRSALRKSAKQASSLSNANVEATTEPAVAFQPLMIENRLKLKR